MMGFACVLVAVAFLFLCVSVGGHSAFDLYLRVQDERKAKQDQ